jgi:hypothetical protein
VVAVDVDRRPAEGCGAATAPVESPTCLSRRSPSATVHRTRQRQGAKRDVNPDPQARLFVWDRVRELRAAGITVVLTTQNMEEAETLADRIGIMDQGRLLALDTPQALTAALPGSATLEITVADEPAPDALITVLGDLGGVERVEQVAAVPAGPPGGMPPGVFRGGPPGGRPGGPPLGASGQGVGGAPLGATATARRDGPLVARLYVTGRAADLIAPVNDPWTSAARASPASNSHSPASRTSSSS